MHISVLCGMWLTESAQNIFVIIYKSIVFYMSYHAILFYALAVMLQNKLSKMASTESTMSNKL